ncbi:MAG: pseudouridine synthase [Bacteroidia bacterium]
MRKENSGRNRSRSYGGKKSGGFEKGNFRKRDDDRKPEEGSSERPRKTFRDEKPKSGFRPERKRSYLGKSNESSFGDRRKNFRDDKPNDDSSSEQKRSYSPRSNENSFGDRRKSFRDDKPNDDSSSEQKRSYSPRSNESSSDRPRRNFRDDRKQSEPPSFMHKKKYADRASKVEKNKRKLDFGQEFTNKEEEKDKEGFDNKKERRSFSGDKRKPFVRKESFGERKDEKTFSERKPFRESERNNFRKDKKDFSRDRKRTPRTVKPESDLIRLNKYISNAGICSRREADEMIEAGVISVNGEIISRLGTKISPTDVVKYNNETLRRERNVYVLLNKPKDYITTSDDPEKRNTVMELIADACKERIYPVGRLDRNTTGVLLFTNDGELTKGLTHPSSNIGKIYHVELDKNVTAADMDKIAAGIELEDGMAYVDSVAYDDPSDKSHIGLEIHSGKNRIVRRIFESLGYDVRKLDRVFFAGLTKKDLSRGRWRFLTDMEVSSLKMMTGKKRRSKTEVLSED